MKKEEVAEVIACLPEERTLFHYFPDRYAFLLLARAIAQHNDLQSIRQSGFSPLLQKPLVKSHLSSTGSTRLHDGWAEAFWPGEGVRSFVLTLGGWGGDIRRAMRQTSRGEHNLVLQLNLNRSDMARFAALVEHPYAYNVDGHPYCGKSGQAYRETLAWARMDVSFATDEVLIEEVQSDFVRYVEWRRSEHRDHAAVRAFVRPFREIWSEAVLAAALDFVWRELGVRTVYYHEHRTGCALKRIRGGLPPRSLYERLPRKFCMACETQPPRMLQENVSARRSLSRFESPAFFRLG